jgi:hypothetical protein
VKPVPIRIQAILSIVAVQRYLILFGEDFRLVPSGYFHLQKIDIIGVIFVAKQCMAQFVQ